MEIAYQESHFPSNQAGSMLILGEVSPLASPSPVLFCFPHGLHPIFCHSQLSVPLCPCSQRSVHFKDVTYGAPGLHIMAKFCIHECKGRVQCFTPPYTEHTVYFATYSSTSSLPCSFCLQSSCQLHRMRGWQREIMASNCAMGGSGWILGKNYALKEQ